MPSHYKGKTGRARQKALKEHKKAMAKKASQPGLMAPAVASKPSRLGNLARKAGGY